jgi:hypothetical protein
MEMQGISIESCGHTHIYGVNEVLVPQPKPGKNTLTKAKARQIWRVAGPTTYYSANK